MKGRSALCIALLLVAAISSSVSAQQSAYLYIDAIKGDAPAPHDGEFKLNSFTYGASAPTSTALRTTGMAVGRPTFGPLKVSMRFPITAHPSFVRNLAEGTRLSSIELRLYNAGKQYYKMVFDNVSVSSVSTEGGDELSQELEFTYARVRWFAQSDASTPPAQIGCWDTTLLKSC